MIRRKATTPGAVYPATAVAALHTWLPDAHSEAPTPVSALPSGSLLAASFYAILRFDQFTAAALGSSFPRDALLAFGVASLLLASLYVRLGHGVRDHLQGRGQQAGRHQQAVADGGAGQRDAEAGHDQAGVLDAGVGDNPGQPVVRDA